MTHSYEQYPQLKQMMDKCKQHKHQYVMVQLLDGYQMDGIILDVDDEYVHLAIPASEQYDYVEQDEYRYGYPGYPGYGYGYGYNPRYRLRRLVLPLVGLAALSLIPW